MADVWLDTTALVDLEFRSAALRQHVLASLPIGSVPRASHYVLFEFARGVFRHYLRLHNKAAELDSLPDLTQYIQNCGVGSQRVCSTMLGAYQDFLRDMEQNGSALSTAQQMEHFRSWLAAHIRRRWRSIQRLIAANPIGCRDDLASPASVEIPAPPAHREHICQTLPTDRCGQPGNCGLIASFQQNEASFRGMLRALEAIENKDAETTARIPALQRLLTQDDKLPFDAKDCYRCGDPIIVSEPPQNTPIISKNAKHHLPLCQALPRDCITYREPAPLPRATA